MARSEFGRSERIASTKSFRSCPYHVTISIKASFERDLGINNSLENSFCYTIVWPTLIKYKAHMRGFRHINAYYRTHLQNQTIYGRVQWVVTHRVASRIISRGGLNGHDFCRCFNLLLFLENVRRRSALIVAVLLGGGGIATCLPPHETKCQHSPLFSHSLVCMYVLSDTSDLLVGEGQNHVCPTEIPGTAAPLPPPHSRAYVY